MPAGADPSIDPPSVEFGTKKGFKEIAESADVDLDAIGGHNEATDLDEDVSMDNKTSNFDRGTDSGTSCWGRSEAGCRALASSLFSKALPIFLPCLVAALQLWLVHVLTYLKRSKS